MAVSRCPLPATAASSSSAVVPIQSSRVSVLFHARPTLARLSVFSSSFLCSSLSLRAAITREGLGCSGGGRASRVTRMSLEARVGVMGTKLGMMSFFQPDGTVILVTVVGFREGNIVTQVKTYTTDCYDIVQIGYRRVRNHKLTRPEFGHLQKAGAIPMRHLQEFRLESINDFEPGQHLLVEDLFKEGNLVDVFGKSIGKDKTSVQTNFYWKWTQRSVQSKTPSMEMGQSTGSDHHPTPFFPWYLLPFDLQESILSLLPISTLALCQSVSRSWPSSPLAKERMEVDLLHA